MFPPPPPRRAAPAHRARAPHEHVKPGKHWPCNSSVAAELFDLLSGGKVPAGLRTAVGSYMVRHGFFKEPEFAIAEARIRQYPKAEWEVASVAPPEGWHEAVDVHYRDALVQVASVLRHPRCDPTTDLVWGPEVETDEDSGQCPHGYQSDFCHSAT